VRYVRSFLCSQAETETAQARKLGGSNWNDEIWHFREGSVAEIFGFHDMTCVALLFSAYSLARITEYVADRIRAEEYTTQTFVTNVIGDISDV
jgi:hypothetical protein